MKEKIRSFMNNSGLTAAQLADQIGVQRSSFSHILNGRNNPSADFISKLLATHPDLNANWLLGNAENMFLSQRIKNKIPDLFSNQEPIKAEEVQQKELIPEKIKPIPTDLNSNSNKKTELQDGLKPEIEKIVIFYNDHTFLEYCPKK